MQQGFYAPPLSKTNRIILIILASFFILYSFMAHVLHIPVELYLGLSWRGISSGFIFQPITYPFINRGIFEFFFNGLLIWFLGYDLEYRWGTRQYLTFLATAILTNALIYLLLSILFPLALSIPLLGLSSLSSVMLLAYASIFPEREFAFMLIFPIKAKYFVAILIFMELYFSSFGVNHAAPISLLLTLLLMSIYLTVILKEHHPLKNYFHNLPPSSSRKRSASHLRIIKEERKADTPPKYWQ